MSSRQGFNKIIGQYLAKRVLKRAVRTRPAHAYLFLGLQGTGKTSTALEFSKALNCENPQDGDACGQCAICHAIEHGNFPDTRIWSPNGRDTTIDHMREMRDMAAFRPSRGKWVINIVEQGDTLNEDSANCILKLLEEPPDYVINILLYRNAANVLATIRSRCQLVRFDQVSTDELSSRLIEDFGLPAHDAEFLATYSQGRPGTAIDLIGNTEFETKRESIAGIAHRAGSGDKWIALALAEAVRAGGGVQEHGSDSGGDDEPPQAARAASARKSARDTATETLDMLLTWYRDMLAIKLQGQDAAIVNTDKREDLLEQSARYAHAGLLLSRVEAILNAKRRIQGNGNPQIVTEALMMRLVH